MRSSISQEIIRLETMMNDLKLMVDGAVNVGTKKCFLSNTTHDDSRRQIDFKTGELKSWTGARWLLHMNTFTMAHARDVISKRTPSSKLNSRRHCVKSLVAGDSALLPSDVIDLQCCQLRDFGEKQFPRYRFHATWK